MVQHVWDILHQHGERRTGFDIVQILNVEARSRIMPEGLWMIRNLTKLGAAHAREGLARRAAHNDVESQRGAAQTQLRRKLLRLHSSDVSGDGVFGGSLVEILPVRPRSVGV